MLVLSRRAPEKILFPSVGITVEVVRVHGHVVRLGIDAPADVPILRGEIGDRTDCTVPQPQQRAHAIRNHLNHLGLALQLFQKQSEAGHTQEANQTAERTLAFLSQLERELLGEPRAQEPHTPAPSPRLRTLIVDDDDNERQLLAGLLEMHGCECQVAPDGQAALEFIERHGKPDVLLLDMWMPRFNGPQTVNRIRSESRFSGLKIFAISGTSPQEAGVVTGPSGVDAWFPKPLNTRQLCEAIRSHSLVSGSN